MGFPAAVPLRYVGVLRNTAKDLQPHSSCALCHEPVIGPACQSVDNQTDPGGPQLPILAQQVPYDPGNANPPHRSIRDNHQELDPADHSPIDLFGSGLTIDQRDVILPGEGVYTVSQQVVDGAVASRALGPAHDQKIESPAVLQYVRYEQGSRDCLSSHCEPGDLRSTGFGGRRQSAPPPLPPRKAG